MDITLAGNQLQISVRLPAPVKEDDVRASYTDGILEVRIPLPEEAEAGGRKIHVSRGAGAASGSAV